MDAESRCSLVSDSAGNRIFQHKEIYGKTKMTGNLGDAIAYGKLAVFPKNYPSKLKFIIPEKENIFEQLKSLQTYLIFRKITVKKRFKNENRF
jgi:hypothetical protein